MTVLNQPRNPVGRLLKQWRSIRRLSQLQLSLEAGVSARHLSFVETGRSRPSREMILRLARALHLPLRETNALLESGGYARLYGESALSDPEVAQVRRVIEFILDRHQPYGAVAVDRRWNVLIANRAHEESLAFFLGDRPESKRAAGNLIRLALDPCGLRPFIVNWEEVARALVDRVHREIGGRPDPETEALLDEILSYPDVPTRWRVPDLTQPPSVVIPIRLRKQGLELALFSAITTLGTPQDVTLQEIRIESFFPADAASDAAIRALPRAAAGE